jgi:hypothetical protein
MEECLISAKVCKLYYNIINIIKYYLKYRIRTCVTLPCIGKTGQTVYPT